ncbi:hypothetical protein L207DRAFT_521997 [Hyaloscypha variabilis F]|uniref:Uncharacterized protein n=1 Tax=Hyaloscypha variabilis (strain UAMH 11265 / GT02V1 / F) TaxID=1149755 RepID=A0A2J6SD13_HYAVF|nr:hypothetical protein L207DRAFT_521997 [Hyaloscypha variabilis F]
MLFSIFTVALLSATALALEQGKRQATDAAQFTAAADQLISEYIPSTALPALESAVSSAASAASVTGDPLSLIYDGLLALSMPGWFSSAIPSGWKTQIAALESNINALRVPSNTGGVVIITTTNSKGSTFTTSSTSKLATVTATTTSGVTATTTATTTTGLGAELSTLTTEVINGATSVFSVAVSGASSVLTTEIINGATSVFSVAVSGASSVGNKASSAVGVATSVVKSASGAERTQVSGCAAGVIGLLGLMAAL